MQYLWNHIEAILAQYDGALPLAHYLKAYYKKHPILGSRDRRGISNAVYAWYRCGKAVAGNGFPFQEQIKQAFFLVNHAHADFAAAQNILTKIDTWNEEPDAYLGAGAWREADKMGWNTQPGEIFPYKVSFSEGISKALWERSLLNLPNLFLRIRKSRQPIDTKLIAAGIKHRWLSGTCLALPNGTKVETILAPDEYWIMDASSQKTGDDLQPQKGESWWDCCSGAGGKALLLKHLEPAVTLTVSDIRESILQNLKARFRQYRIPPPEAIVADASDEQLLAKSLAGRRFDAIICDAPCTGSGTWARTPEGAYFFREDALAQYAARQKAILCNAAKYLKPGGRIIYITCSVFEAENEAVVRYTGEKTGLAIQSSRLINGVEQGADCLYTATLSRA